MATNQGDAAPPAQTIQVATGVALTVQLAPKTIRMYYLTEEQLETVASLNLTNSVYLAVFGICLGLLAAFWITLATVDIRDARTHATFVALALASGILAVVFGVLFGLGYVRRRAEIRRAKRNESIGTVTPLA